jgi:hypothetical protein
MAITEVLITNIGVLVLQFVLFLILIWYIWYLNTTYQNNYDELNSLIVQQNEILIELAKKDNPEFKLKKRIKKVKK